MLQSRVQFICNRTKLRTCQRSLKVRVYSSWKPKRLVPDFYPKNYRPLTFVESWREKVLLSSGSTQDVQKERKQEVDHLFELMKKLFGEEKESSVEETISEAKRNLPKMGIAVDQVMIEDMALESIRRGAPTVVPFLIRTALLLGVVVETKFYEVIGQNLVENRCWAPLENMLAFCFEGDVPFSSTLLDIHLRAMLHFEDYTSLRLGDVRKLFASYECQFTRQTWNLLIEAAVANRNMQGCRNIIKEMETSGFQINEETHNAVLSRLFAMGPNPILEYDIFSSLIGADSRLNTSILNSLIRLRSIARDHSMVTTYLNYLRQPRANNLTPGSLPSAERWKEIQPDSTTISILLEHFTRRNDLKAATHAFSLFSRLRLTPFPEDVAHLLKIYGKMRQTNGFFAITSALCDGLPEQVKRQVDATLLHLGWDGVHSQHEVSSVTINIYIINAFVDIVMRTHGLEGFSAALDIMDSLLITPDEDTVRSLLYFVHKYEQKNSDFLAATLYRLFSYPGVRIRPRMRHLNIVLHSILLEHRKLVKGEGGWKGAAAFLSQRRSRKLPEKVRPKIVEHAHTTFGIADGTKDPESVKLTSLRHILRSIKDSGANPDEATYSIKMFYYARVTKDVESVKRLYESLVSSGLRPNAYHVAALIEACCIAGHVQAAEDVLNSAQANQLTVNRVHYSLLICAYGDEGKPEKGHEVFKRMLRDNVVLDITSLECLVRGYFMSHDYVNARKVLLQYWNTVAPRSTVPHDRVALGDALSLLRDLERQQQPGPPTLGEAANPVIKEILRKWRKVVMGRPTYRPAPAITDSPHNQVGPSSEDMAALNPDNIRQ